MQIIFWRNIQQLCHQSWVNSPVCFTAQWQGEIIIEIKNGLDEAGIEMPFPARTVYFGTDKEVEATNKA